MDPVFAVLFVAVVGVIVALVARRRGGYRDGASSRSAKGTPVELPPTIMAPPPTHPGMPARLVEVQTAAGVVRVTHAGYSSDVTAGGGGVEMQAVWDFAAANRATRMLIDLPPFGPSSRRFFHALRVTGFCAGSWGGLLVIRHHPPIPGGPDWFPSDEPQGPYYMTVSVETPLNECLELAATAQALTPVRPDDLD